MLVLLSLLYVAALTFPFIGTEVPGSLKTVMTCEKKRQKNLTDGDDGGFVSQN